MVIGTQLIEKFLFKIAKQWIAGNTIDDALISAKSAYKSGRHAIIDGIVIIVAIIEPLNAISRSVSLVDFSSLGNS